ncbi:uncharacterized protein BDR25DRAFT_368132 [Lindgomyces ingoldianus]|uniref:Uncharacterized protein n=1 Tax=Lindgomyces ingoldianus TaxID=673940 RepID=A0ACB6QYZ8_9PLEO|nr:uncharacterized protein BDR25DRAFT_368132 [Lindgomyces ingoldianus]KAF2471322.1 hypothetical protein BDR25DRAFT_368132 [Lindgomyces ingoldianus]
MADPASLQVFSHDILPKTSEWHFRDSIEIPRDLGQYCKTNSAIEFKQDGQDVSFCVLVSAGCSHIAAVEVYPLDKSIKVTSFHSKDGLKPKWTVTHHGREGEFPTSQSTSRYDTDHMDGGITEDGEAVLLVYRPRGGATVAYLVNADGFTLRKPPSDTALRYSTPNGSLSEDSEYLFYTRDGTPWGKSGEAKVVEAYSIRHLARMRAVTFAFGDGQHLRNTCLHRPLRVRGTIYMGINTSDFGGEGIGRGSPPLIVSSDKKLHWNFDEIDIMRSGSNISISPDDSSMFYIGADSAMLYHWDLRNPSLKPLGSVRLPGVEYSQYRKWVIHGKETSIKDAIAEQTHAVRFSSNSKVITVVTLNNKELVINALLAFNLQVIFHEKVAHPLRPSLSGLPEPNPLPQWTQLLPLRIGFNDDTGLTIFAMYPADITRTPNGLLRLWGVSGILISLPKALEKIKMVEDYFDSSADRLLKLVKAVDNKEVNPVCRFGWKPGVVDRNDPDAFELEHGQLPNPTSLEQMWQQDFYEKVFAQPGSSVRMNSSPELWRFFLPQLFSFTYPWNQAQRVSVFGVVMKNEYHLIVIGPSPISPEQTVIRALYATDIKISGDGKEQIELYKSYPNFFLRVSYLGDRPGGYSGAPMPIPRWTIISPHFLEEDAWYDTFIIHRGAHVTMPSNWSQTPNPALMSTANYYAYFKPYTFVVQDNANYGHRDRSAYVLPKYLLWREYGLRGLRKGNPNDIFFGGGRFADSVGSYLQIYKDQTYDDTNPLYPGIFALACNADHRAQKTQHVDAFFRRLHQDDRCLLENSHAVSHTLPLACRTRPIATLSFMRHVALFQFKVNNIGPVAVKNGATQSKVARYDGKWGVFYHSLGDLKNMIQNVWKNLYGIQAEPNSSHVTLPLPGFCSFTHKLYRPPPVSASPFNDRDDSFWEFVRATMPTTEDDKFPRWEVWIHSAVKKSGRGPSSPFTRLVEEILDMKDRETQLSFLRVIWLEKLLAWKMRTFGLWLYLTRTALPMLVLFSVHLTIAVLLTAGGDYDTKRIPGSIILLAVVEALVACFVLSVKLRQLYRVPQLFFGSFFNYIDATAVSLGLTTFFLVVSKKAPSRSFLGFSTLLIWIASILMLRIYRPLGMLLLLLTETFQEVFSFLALLFFIILGFAFVPFLLLRNLNIDQPTDNPFSTFPLAFGQMLNFISSDYGALEPYQSSSTSIRTLRALYIVIITIFFLNTLIAMLNLKIKRADKNAENLYHLQMASLQVEIELGLLSASERSRRDWFPEWFSYSMTETEKRVWNDYLEKNPLKWTEENSFGEDKDHAPLVPVEQPPKTQVDARSTTTAGQSSSTVSRRNTKLSEPLPQSGGGSVEVGQQQETIPISASQTPTASSFSSTRPTPNPAPPPQGNDSEPLLQSQSPPEASTPAPPQNSKPTSATEHPCKICAQPGHLCTSCRLVAYCSKEHQKQDWKAHKKDCKGKGKV